MHGCATVGEALGISEQEAIEGGLAAGFVGVVLAAAGVAGFFISSAEESAGDDVDELLAALKGAEGCEARVALVRERDLPLTKGIDNNKTTKYADIVNSIHKKCLDDARDIFSSEGMNKRAVPDEAARGRLQGALKMIDAAQTLNVARLVELNQLSTSPDEGAKVKEGIQQRLRVVDDAIEAERARKAEELRIAKAKFDRLMSLSKSEEAAGRFGVAFAAIATATPADDAQRAARTEALARLAKPIKAHHGLLVGLDASSLPPDLREPFVNGVKNTLPKTLKLVSPGEGLVDVRPSVDDAVFKRTQERVTLTHEYVAGVKVEKNLQFASKMKELEETNQRCARNVSRNNERAALECKAHAATLSTWLQANGPTRQVNDVREHRFPADANKVVGTRNWSIEFKVRGAPNSTDKGTASAVVAGYTHGDNVAVGLSARTDAPPTDEAARAALTESLLYDLRNAIAKLPGKLDTPAAAASSPAEAAQRAFVRALRLNEDPPVDLLAPVIGDGFQVYSVKAAYSDALLR